MARNKYTSHKGTSKSQNVRNPYAFMGVIIAMISFAILYVILAGISIAPKPSLMEGEVSNHDIKATRDVVDVYTTNLYKQNARDNVSPMFTLDDTLTKQTLDDIVACYDSIDAVRVLASLEYKRMQENSEEQIKYTEAFFDQSKESLPNGFSSGDVINIISIEIEELMRLKELVISRIEADMGNGIKDEETVFNARIQDFRQQLILDGYSEDGRKLGLAIYTIYLKANLTYDVNATEAARDAAQDIVGNITYREGEIIVNDGMIVTKAQMAVLEELGLIESENTAWMEYTSVGMILMLLFLVGILYLNSFQKSIIKSTKLVSVMLMVIVLTISFTWACSYINAYIIPVVYAPLILVLIMFDKRVALFMNILISILVGMMAMRFGDSIVLPIVTAAFLGGSVSVFTISNTPQRSTLMVSGVLSGLVMAAVYVLYDVTNHVAWLAMLLHGSMGLASGLLASILAIGTLPMWESMFKLVTSMRLLELTNPNQPLLKKLLVEAPGTYHHSIMVGNMAERAANAIGANPLLVRTGAFYHDIGKTKRPFFFSENQSGHENPHDNIEPDLSTRIITSHVTDGIELARRGKIPQVIQDIVGQHHGDTAVQYFYVKQKNKADDPDSIKLDDFRYPGIRPQSREAAILMMADSCEAAVRALNEPNPEKIRKRIDKVIKMKLDDGQFNYCDITMNDMTIIKREFFTALNGVNHDRVEYPKEKPRRK